MAERRCANREPVLVTLRICKLLDALEKQRVEFILSGSVVFALHGAAIHPNDLDIVPECSPANLERVAAALADLSAAPLYVPGWKGGLSLEECRSWSPDPATENNLDHLFVTRHGLLDVVPKLAGTFGALSGAASSLEVCGRYVRACSPLEVFRRIEAAGRTKDALRLERYRDVLARLEFD